MSTARVFRSNQFGGPAVTPRSLGIPAAAYPGRVATNSDLIVAVDRQQTTLLLPMAVADTTMTVLDASMIVGYNLLSIENEIVKTTGPPGGNVVPIARGFDGTAAAHHNANTPVYGLVDAYHHNALVAEVEAIETFLGPHGSNLPNPLVPATSTTLGGVKIGSGVAVQTDGTISVALPLVVSSNYIFPPQSPGGSLIVGANTITLSPVPAGINGTNTGHVVYISGGTGTPEAALIIGGSAVSGAASGTLIVQCANAHSGAWTIQSATAGIMEAIWTFAGNGGNVLIPPGNWNIYGTMQWAGNSLQLMGLGKASRIVYQPTSGDIFYFNAGGLGVGTGYRNQLQNFFIDVAASGGTVTGVHINGQVEFLAAEMMINNVQYGFKIEGQATTSMVWIDKCHIEGLTGTTGIGVWQLGGADIYIIDSSILGFSANQPIAGIQITYSTGTKIMGCDCFATGFGLLINPGNSQQVLAVDSCFNWYDSAGTDDGMGIVPTGTGVAKQIVSVGDWFVTAHRNGIEFGSAGTIDGVIIADARIYNNQQSGILYSGGTNVDFLDCHVSGNSQAGAGSYHGMAVASGAGGFRVRGGIYGQSGGWSNSQGYGILINGGASNNYTITGAKFTANMNASMSDAGTGLNKIIKDNLGISNIIGSDASAATISLGLIPQEIYRITGTTTITTITGGWTGRVIRLLKSDAGSLTIGGGGNIPGSHTLAQYGSMVLTFADDGNWY